MPVEEIDLDELPGYLNGIVNDLETGRMDRTLNECRHFIAAGMSDNFQRAAGATGTPWPAHALSTVAKYGTHPLLIYEGYMQESVTVAGAANNIFEIAGGRELTWGTDIVYAATHQYGDPSRGIPQREFVYISDEAADACVELIATAGMDELLGT